MQDAPEPGGGASQRSAGLRGILFFVVAMFLFATMDGLSKYLTATYSPIQVLWVRYMIFAGFVLALAAPAGIIRQARSRRPILQVVRAAILVFESGIIIWAFHELPVADVHAILSAAPLVVTVLAVLVLHERVGFHRRVAVLAGFIGTLVIVRPGASTAGWIVVVPLAGMVLFALLQISTRMLGKVDRHDTTAFYTGVIGLIVVSFAGPFFWTWPGPADLALLALAGAMGALAHYLTIRALHLAEASALQPYSYTLLVWAVPVGYIGFGDLPDMFTIAGALIVTASGLYVVHRERARAAARPN